MLEEAAAQQAKFLRAIADDNGRLPQIGDDDGGQLFPICGRPASDCSDTLSSAAAILNDPSLTLGVATEESFWFCGEPIGHGDRLGVATTSPSDRRRSHPAATTSRGRPAETTWSSTLDVMDT